MRMIQANHLSPTARRRLSGRAFMAAMLVTALLSAACASDEAPSPTQPQAEQPTTSAPTTSAGIAEAAPQSDTDASTQPATSEDPERPLIGIKPSIASTTTEGGAVADEPPPTSAPDTGAAVPGNDVEAARQQIKSAVDFIIAPGPPQPLSNAELGCLSASVLDSLTDERALELAPRMTQAAVVDGLPADLLTEAEVDTVLGAASGCVDWPAALERSFALEGLGSEEAPTCLIEVTGTEQYARGAAQLMLFDAGNAVSDLIALVGKDCLVEAIWAEVDQSVDTEGMSAESKACLAESAVELLVTAAAMDMEGSEDEEGFLMMGMMFLMLGCLGEAEMEQFMSEEPIPTSTAP